MESALLIAKYHNLGSVQAMLKVTHNSTNEVFIVNDDYVIKIFSSPDGNRLVVKDSVFCTALHGNLPTPAVIGQGAATGLMASPYLIFTRLPGISLELTWDTLSEPTRAPLCGRLGSLLAKVHSLPAGLVKKAWDEAVPSGEPVDFEQRMTSALAAVEDKQLLSPRNLEAVRCYFSDRAEHCQRTTMGLQHGCFRPGNILTVEDTITGLIDWEDAIIGDTLEELSLTLYRTIPHYLQEVFLDSYRRIYPVSDDLDRCRLVYPLLYYLSHWPEVATWNAGRQEYYNREIKRVLEDTIGEEN